jgi:prepilin-type N-terminal cleavage/methylation domain-containing protein
MKNTGHLSQRRAAFTLIELIVVIAIIAILASLIFPIVSVINRQKQISTAQTQLKAIEMAIDGYKTKLGYYPPDNTNNFTSNQLYFELIGTTNNGAGLATGPTSWGTVDGTAQIDAATANSVFGITGFANTSTRAHSDDEGAAASTFINNLTPNQIGLVDPALPNVKILVCSVVWPGDKAPIMAKNPTMNPFQYNSSHPTNNTGSYDLWVDIVLKGKTNRVCNWSAQPVKL